ESFPGQRLVQAWVELQPAVKAHHGHDPQHARGRHHAQLGTVCGAPLGGLHQLADSTRVTERGSCHIRDDGRGSGGKRRLKILTETVSVAHVDLGGQRDHRHPDRTADRGLCFDHGRPPPGSLAAVLEMAGRQEGASLEDRGWLVNRQNYFALRNERLSFVPAGSLVWRVKQDRRRRTREPDSPRWAPYDRGTVDEP